MTLGYVILACRRLRRRKVDLRRVWNLNPKHSAGKIELNLEVIKESKLPEQATTIAIHAFRESSYHIDLRRAYINRDWPVIHSHASTTYAACYHGNYTDGVKPELKSKERGKTQWSAPESIIDRQEILFWPAIK